MYLMVCTRPDIAFAVCFLARACAAPEKRHLKSVMKLVKYLKGTMNDGIFYPTTKSGENAKFELKGYADAAFADCLQTRKTTGGYLFCLNNAPLTWQSKRQSLVVTSTTEGEYVAVCEAAKEAVWLRLLLADMGCEQIGPTLIYEDNDGAKAQTENPLHHKRTKHVDIAYHYSRQLVSDEIVILERIDTKDQLADIMTKPLVRSVFERLYNMLGMKATALVALKAV